MLFTLDPTSKPNPIRDVVLNKEDLLKHAAEIAHSHAHQGPGAQKRELFPRANDNAKFLKFAHSKISEYVSRTGDMAPAAEWFLDNYYLLKDFSQEIRKELPFRYERQLPRVNTGPLHGLPRIFALVIEFIGHTDSQLQADSLKAFINTYQEQVPLTSGELWAIPVMLRIALLENIRRLVEEILMTHEEWEEAEKWISPFLRHELEPNKWSEILKLTPKPEKFSSPFGERLAKRIRNLGPEGAPILHWLDKSLIKQGTTVEQLTKLEHQSQAMCQVSMGHAITSIRFLVEEDWPRFYEEVSSVEKLLKKDPGEIYQEMDFVSRDKYRHQVEKIARRFKVSESLVAKKVLELAEGAGDKEGLPSSHVGYYLLGKGCIELEKEMEKEWGALRCFYSEVKRSLRQKPSTFYFGGILLIMSAILAIYFFYILNRQSLGLGKLVLFTLILIIPVSSIAILLVNWGVTCLLPPAFMPKMELRNGIPEELRTMVVIPTLLTSVSRVKELLEQMEIFYLANQDRFLHFALLGDFADNAAEEAESDQEILDSAIQGVYDLNKRHGGDRFYLFHRKRLWNEAEGVWMGWERKRGKLVEFNRLLTGNAPTGFIAKIGDLSILSSIRFIITLDADTQLPRGAAKKLIGTLAHPLQTPRLRDNRVVEGYGILQPRISISVKSARETTFSRIFSGKVGVDPYTAAVSDVYQDLFGEGSFTGKGIYDLRVFHQTTGEAFPENSILSHDLIEGIYARTGLVTDIELIDGFPAKVHAYMKRLHRWVRGDWQILPWLFKELTLVSRWKIFDNLRRSLEAPAQVLIIALAFLFFPGSAWIWAGLVILNLLMPTLLGYLNRVLCGENSKGVLDLTEGLFQAGLLFAFLPYRAYIKLDAIIRSLYRQFVSKRHMLEWETALDTERRLDVTPGAFWKVMAPGVIISTGLLLIIAVLRPEIVLDIIVLAVVWGASPWLAYRISKPVKQKQDLLSSEEQTQLRGWARRVWAFFADFVNDKENWLPPDNVQIDPPNGVAHRTSPTNIGLALLVNLGARNLGYISQTHALARIDNTVNTLEGLERWKGHFYNWYDTLTLKPLHPLYVSTVDSGNLVVYLMTVKSGLEDLLGSPLVSADLVQGIKDTYKLLLKEAGEDKDLSSFGEDLDWLLKAENLRLSDWYAFLLRWTELPRQDLYWSQKIKNMVEDFLQELLVYFPWLKEDDVKQEKLLELGSTSLLDLEHYLVLAEKSQSQLTDSYKRSLSSVRESIGKIRKLQERIDNLAIEHDFGPLYDQERQLFSIGYRVGDQALDKSYYDLLASEARQASYIAIIKGDIPQVHWFRLGRSLTRAKGRRSLVSWSGTMFEFLMPILVMRNYPGTLLDETYSAVVEIQKSFADTRGIPWGISESGFYAFDSALNYQYKAFGVPGLGLKRGLIKDLVIAPYATFMALMVAPKTALANINRMESLGFSDRYGLFEAIDYTKERIPTGKKFRIIKSYMAHHQGMSFLALNNVLNDNVMQNWFHSQPLVKSGELLLQERVPLASAVSPQPEEKMALPQEKAEGETLEEQRFVTYSTAQSAVPLTHFVSNGQYSVMLTNSGSGYSKFNNLYLSRWREDVTLDARGMYFYIQNLNSGELWSATHQPIGYSGENYRVTYAPDRVEFYRRDGNIGTKTEIVISPEDQVEIRRLSLTNYSQHSRTIDITSYFEVVLAGLNEDMAHPAFGNLFVETEFTNHALLATKRPRREDQVRHWLMHTVAVQGEVEGALQYETDRARFIGRGRNLSRPRALELNQPLSNSVGAVLDPIMSLRQRIKIKPGQTAEVSYTVGMAPTREDAVRLAEKYRDSSAIDRVFELAWTFSQMELKHLNLSPDQANQALSLGGSLLYLSPCRKDYATEIKQNTKGQSSLWPLAISGDLPVVLARVMEHQHLDLVAQVLKIHEYWRLKGLAVDLVILNEDKTGYLQKMQDSLRDMVSGGHARELLNRQGGIFLLQRDNLSGEEIILLQSIARITFTGEGGSCSVQLRKKGKLLAAKMERKEKTVNEPSTTTSAEADSRDQGERNHNLDYANGYGGFSEDGKEYVITLRKGIYTPLPWSNVIANKHFGCLVSESGGGFTWSGNSRENKLTPWSNDPVVDPQGEILYLRDETNGDLWTTTRSPIRDKDPYNIRHGQGYTVFEHRSHGLDQEQLVFVHKDLPVKIISLKLVNRLETPRILTATYYAEVVMGVARELTAPYIVTEYSQNSLLARNTYQEEFSGRVSFLSGINAQIRSFTGDRTEFMGRNGTANAPQGLLEDKLGNSVGAGLDPCLALQMEISLAPGEEKIVTFLLGEADSREDVKDLLAGLSTEERVAAALDEVKGFWDDLLGKIQIRTPEKSLDILMNRWLLYQTIACRLWGRSAFYQSGGAFGFRDQLQDVMSLAMVAPNWTREQILLHCQHQFVEGDVQHWWHAEKNKGIRTKFSDDLLWLPFVTADYIEHSGDYSLLEEQVQFLEDEPLGEEEDERYSIPKISEETASVYEHCVRSIERSLKFGEHGLPLIGSGDWNDGFSRIGIKGKGESVWLAWFLYLTLIRFSRLSEKREDFARVERYTTAAEQLRENIEKNAWDGGWYRRAYFDDGTPLGSASNDECQIDCIAQAWAVFSGAAKPARAKDAMLALEHYLLRKEEGILLLLTPPFNRFTPDPGYIKGYVPGVRENGGQYTHGAIWAILAYAKMGRGDKAVRLFNMLNPINHSRTEHEVARYKVEPYVMTADIYATPAHLGRGGWSWYTGAAGWMYQAGLEGILGIMTAGDRLTINPCIPPDWQGYEVDYKYKDTLYRIKVKNPNGKMAGVSSQCLDGAPVDAIQLTDDGLTHEISVII